MPRSASPAAARTSPTASVPAPRSTQTFNATVQLSIEAKSVGDVSKGWDDVLAFASARGFKVGPAWLGEGPRVVASAGIKPWAVSYPYGSRSAA